VRLSTVFNKLLNLVGAWVTGVEFDDDEGVVVVDVRLRRRLLECPHCGWRTSARHNWQPAPSTWRTLDFGIWQVWVRCHLRRLDCWPCEAVVVEAVPFARHRARFTRDFEDLVAWLVAHTDKTAVTRLVRINWRSTGTIVERVVADQLDDTRLDDLFEAGVDEVSYRKQHHYLTLVTNHRRGTVVWAEEGRDADTLTGFFDELGPARCTDLQAMSMDMGPAYIKAVREHEHTKKHVTICYDPFHVVMNANKALDVVRRGYWNELRARAGPDDARRFKHARWALLKRPENLTDSQKDQLVAIKRAGGAVWRAHQLKEALRAVFDPDLEPHEAAQLLDAWLAWAQRCRLPSFVKLARTLRAHRDGILAALELGINNGRTEGLNRKVRSITSRAFGFHSAKAVAAMIMLCCGPVELHLPHDTQPGN
jgi:transposase